MTPYRDYDDTPLAQLMRQVMRSFRVGSCFGVEVRMYWAALLLMPLLFASWTAPFVSSFGEGLVLVAIQFLGLFATIWTHEMGHIAMGWRFHVHTDLVTLSPLGGVAHMNAPAPTPRAELCIALAGPAVHLLWLALLWPLQWLLPTHLLVIDGWRFDPLAFTLWFLVTTNTGLLLFNLLPLFPLDGGRSARALLAMRWQPNRVTMWVTTAGLVGGGMLILLGLSRARVESSVTVMIGLCCISACINERRSARHAPIYGAPSRDSWQIDPEAWKRGDSERGEGGRGQQRPGAFARWRHQRLARRKAKRQLQAAQLDREVDAVLERLHQVGMTGLSSKEKTILKRAAQQRRGAG